MMNMQMNKQRMGFILLLILLFTFMLGYGLANVAKSNKIWTGSRKPALNIVNIERRIQKDTPVIFEKEYQRSAKVIVSEFPYQEDIIGKTLTEIRKKYSIANGFTIYWQDTNLMIHQSLDDWSPGDKQTLRLKEYRGMVAVYQGYDEKNDGLLRVTAIRFSTLPTQIQQSIREGKYEFKDEQALNDALENMDEYI